MDATTVRNLLETERDELARIAAAERDAIARPADALPDERGASDQHQADAASETFDRECDVTILRMVDERTAEVAHALRKLDAGTYGTCEACGELIPDARLRARPDARFCARCGAPLTVPGEPNTAYDGFAPYQVTNSRSERIGELAGTATAWSKVMTCETGTKSAKG